MESMNLPQHFVWCRQGIDPWLKLHLSTLYRRDESAFTMGHIEEWVLCRDKQTKIQEMHSTFQQKHKCIKVVAQHYILTVYSYFSWIMNIFIFNWSYAHIRALVLHCDIRHD